MYKLFKNGKELCEVKECRFYQGKQETTYFNSIGDQICGWPRIPIRERKDVDRVTFVTSIRLELRSKHELRGDEGNSWSIMIENINIDEAIKQNQSFVEAVIY